MLDIFAKNERERYRGILAIITKDYTEETWLRRIMKDLRIDHKLGINLLKLCNPSDKTGKYNAAYAISKSICNDPELVSAFVGVLSKDISNARLIWNKMNINWDKMAMALSFTTGNMEFMEKHMKKMADLLEINEDTLSKVAKLASCNVDALKSLAQDPSKSVTWDVINTLTSLIDIKNIGTQRLVLNSSLDFSLIQKCSQLISANYQIAKGNILLSCIPKSRLNLHPEIIYTHPNMSIL